MDRRLYVIAFTVLMTQLSISALNEWADRDRDAAARRHRPVALGRISPQIALSFAVLFALAALPGALSFGVPSLAMVLIGVGMGWAYDLVLKPTPFSFVPFALAFPLLPAWVGMIAGRPPSALLPFFLAGAPLAVSIHLADSIPDEAADAAAGIRTMAIGLGRSLAIRVMQATLLLGCLVLVISLLRRQLPALFLTLVAVLGTAMAGQAGSNLLLPARWVVTATVLVTVVTWMVVRYHA